MKRQKRRKYTVKTKSRMFIIFLLFGGIISTLSYSLLNNFYQISILQKEKKNLEKELAYLDEQTEVLEADIEKLSDPDYIARYVREKYYYSKKGELIIRMDN